MRVHVFQHVAFEGIGSIETWLAARYASVSYTRFFQKASLPRLPDFDLLIVMGGPMGANDEGEFRWLGPEKGLIAAAIESGKPVLGICLGAQLIASALDARVYPNPRKEIGWFPVWKPSSGVLPRVAAAIPDESLVFLPAPPVFFPAMPARTRPLPSGSAWWGCSSTWRSPPNRLPVWRTPAGASSLRET